MLAVLAAVLALPVAGCGDGLGRDVDRIEQTIRAQPGVAAVDMGYTSSFTQGTHLLPEVQLTATASPDEIAALVRTAAAELNAERFARAGVVLQVVAAPGRLGLHRQAFRLRDVTLPAGILEAEARAWSALVLAYPGVLVEIRPTYTPGDLHGREVHVQTEPRADPAAAVQALRSIGTVSWPAAAASVAVTVPDPPDPSEHESWSRYRVAGVPPEAALDAMEALARAELAAGGQHGMMAAGWNSSSLIVTAQLDETDAEHLGPACVDALDGSGLPYELTIRAPYSDDVLLHAIGGP